MNNYEAMEYLSNIQTKHLVEAMPCVCPADWSLPKCNRCKKLEDLDE